MMIEWKHNDKGYLLFVVAKVTLEGSGQAGEVAVVGQLEAGEERDSR